MLNKEESSIVAAFAADKKADGVKAIEGLKQVRPCKTGGSFSFHLSICKNCRTRGGGRQGH